MRTVSINFGEEIRDLCEEQSEYDSQIIKLHIDKAYTLYDTERMTKNAIKKQVFIK